MVLGMSVEMLESNKMLWPEYVNLHVHVGQISTHTCSTGLSSTKKIYENDDTL